MMKKIISVCLSVVLVLAGLLTVSAKNTNENVQISVDIQTVHVTVTADKQGNLTGYIQKDTDIYGVLQAKASEETEEGFVYQLSFVMPLHADKGTYTLCLGDVYHEDVAFDFVGLKAMMGDFNQVDQAEASEIYGVLTAEDSTIPYDMTQYASLKKEVRDLVDAEIASWPLAATIDTVETVANTFVKNMDELMNRALLASADADQFETLAKNAIKNKLLDGRFFDKVKAETVRKYMDNRTVTSITNDAISTAFSESVLLAVAETADYITLYDATVYYEEKDIVKMDAEALKALEKENLHYDVFKKLKDDTYLSVSLYEKALETVIDEYMEETEEEESSSGGGSGSSSGGGSGSSGGGVKGATAGNSSSQKPAVKPVPVTFSDIDSVTWAKPAITYLAERGIVSGRGNGEFAPNDTVTREEFVKLIVATFATNIGGSNCSFEDVSSDRWSYPYIATATELGLVNGVDDTHFNPTGGITREDLAVILYRAYQLAGKDAKAFELSFADADSISDYAKDAVSALVEIGVMNGMGDGTFAPKSVVTRAQAAKAIYELLMIVGGGKA